jgi:FkbM family methyltransferase
VTLPILPRSTDRRTTAMINGLASVLVDRIGPRVVRAAIRYLPPRQRGLRLSRAWGRITSHRPPLILSRERSGIRLRCDLRDELTAIIFYRGWVDRDLEAWLSRWLRPGDTYVDVGAHIGFYVSLALAAIGPSGRVIAFEPLRESYEKLAASVREARDRYPNVEVHRAALGANRGETTIFRPTGRWEHQTYRASLVAAGDRVASERVSVLTLDEALGTTSCRLLKIDVEGSELEILRGGRSFLSDGRAEAIVIEINPSALRDAGTTADRLVELLAADHYRPHQVEGTKLVPRDEIEVAGEFANFVFLPEDR